VSVDYSLRAYQAYAHRLSPADADRFVDEMRISGRLVGLDEELASKSVDELRSYLDGMKGQMLMTEPTQAFFRAFLRARMPLSMRALWLLHVVGMLGLLPPEVRALYGAPRWVPTGRITRLSIRLFLRGMNVVYPVFKPIRDARRRLDELYRD
jgi:uncharacterized protein (DUF2236 family)